MSHFIGCDFPTQKSKIVGIATQIIPPNYTTMLTKKVSGQPIVLFKDQALQQTKNLAKKLINKQENVRQKAKQFEKLKERLYHYGRSKAENSNLLKDNMSNSGSDAHLNLVDSNKKIYIQKKYNNQFSIKLHLIQRDQQIYKNKQAMRLWNTSQNHSSKKSPNYRKMKFLLERVGYSPQTIIENPVVKEQSKKQYKPYLGNKYQRQLYKFKK